MDGRNPWVSLNQHLWIVEIQFQSSPALMDGRNRLVHPVLQRVTEVAILARPHGRAQPDNDPEEPNTQQKFQSSPALMDGRNYLSLIDPPDTVTVSILARPHGRAQPFGPVETIEE